MTHTNGYNIISHSLMKISLLLLTLATLSGLAAAYAPPYHCTEDDEIDCADDIRAGTTGRLV